MRKLMNATALRNVLCDKSRSSILEKYGREVDRIGILPPHSEV
ncbi:hypothetical protein [Aneurinibacillus migulanus]|nr:hypothetical protein [Aneurinibacillus migulanus]MED0894991.1 hypothetical protein [Aneurinibacillus migulanus]MED1614781.1 hypothetical protein [Aneurinibacillus migulanus]MED4727276.1 hypothetical protein [Aneurinibacillus migulanus]